MRYLQKEQDEVGGPEQGEGMGCTLAALPPLPRGRRLSSGLPEPPEEVSLGPTMSTKGSMPQPTGSFSPSAVSGLSSGGI